MTSNINQENIINSNDNLLVIASAGCGKSYTITRKIEKLLKKISPKEILVISFTNETVNDLKKKINNEVNIMTFHKLAQYVLKKAKLNYTLCCEDLINYTINNYFENIINNNDKKKMLLYFATLNYEKLINSKEFKNYKKVIITFIKLMQCNNYDLNFLKNVFINEKDKFLITIIMKIYTLYNIEKSENDMLDLDDLIIKASIASKKLKFDYKYIFVDEFQDTSEIRFNLIYNIFKNSNSKINFFGDDYQSIYAFSGCNLNIMLNIQDKIKDIKIIQLTQNYRSDNKLIQSANSFVENNPLQIKKKVSSKLTYSNSINFIYYSNYYKCINKLLKKLEKETTDIMILGRYKSDFKYIDNTHKKLTIHESKGLEATYVLILNLKDDCYGLPSKVRDNRLLNYFKNSDPFPYAEERRIFYVAITRAKKKVFLLVPRKNRSVFIPEFKKIIKKL